MSAGNATRSAAAHAAACFAPTSAKTSIASASWVSGAGGGGASDAAVFLTRIAVAEGHPKLNPQLHVVDLI